MKPKCNLERIEFDFQVVECCPGCENDILIPHNKIEWLDNDFWYVICGQCGLKMMSPRPTMDSYREFYKNQFWQQKIRNKGFKKAGQLWQGGLYKYDNDQEWDPQSGRENIANKQKDLRVRKISDAISNAISISPSSRIIEVGCAYGITLHALKDSYGCQVFAVEPSEEARSYIDRENRAQLIGYYAEELELISKRSEKFDAVIFSHVLENTVDPIQILQAAKDCISKQGVIYIETPNLYICDQMNPYHPYIFSHQSLKRIVEKVGLKYSRISKPIDRMLTVICSLNCR